MKSINTDGNLVVDDEIADVIKESNVKKDVIKVDVAKERDMKESDIPDRKKKLRKDISALRDSLEIDELESFSEGIFARARQLPVYQECENVLVYTSFRSEVYTFSFILSCLREGKKVYVPKVIGKEMEFIRIYSINELESGYMGIKEPVYNADSEVYASCLDKTLMIMPGMVFDKSFHRIGYGGGFYDRYLAKHKDICKLGVAYSCQVLDDIPYEETDVTLDYIVTEEKIFKKQ